MSALRKRLGIIGAGRAGTALGSLLSRRGWKVAAVASSRIVPARRLARLCGARIATIDPERAAAAADAVLITVPDRALVPLARTLASGLAGRRKTLFLHTSGAFGASALAPLARRGCAVGSFHPLLAFPRDPRGLPVFEGATFAIDGDPPARRLARALAASLGGVALTIPANRRARYHLAACLASNYVVTLAAEASSLLIGAGLTRRRALEALVPLMRSTITNLEAAGIPEALTGPVARGDAVTIERHATLLRRAPADLRALHRALVRRTALLVRATGWLDDEVIARIVEATGD